jgi:hypothetical protein
MFPLFRGFTELGRSKTLLERSSPGKRLFSVQRLHRILAYVREAPQGILVKKKKSLPSRKKTAPAKSKKDFPAVFAALKKILTPYAKRLSVVRYKPEFYYLETVLPGDTGKPVLFGAVRLGKNYVSYYLMPVYMDPALQKRISPELRRRMQGKSCFNFTEIDPVLFSELADLTATGFTGFRAMRLV